MKTSIGSNTHPGNVLRARADYYESSAPQLRQRRTWRLAGCFSLSAQLEVPVFTKQNPKCGRWLAVSLAARVAFAPAHEAVISAVPFSLHDPVTGTGLLSVQRRPTRTSSCVPMNTRDSP
jgi:hypothetical protein